MRHRGAARRFRPRKRREPALANTAPRRACIQPGGRDPPRGTPDAPARDEALPRTTRPSAQRARRQCRRKRARSMRRCRPALPSPSCERQATLRATSGRAGATPAPDRGAAWSRAMRGSCARVLRQPRRCAPRSRELAAQPPRPASAQPAASRPATRPRDSAEAIA